MPHKPSRPSRRIGDIAFSNNDILADLYNRSLAMIELQDSIRHELGAPLNEHLYIANFSPETITVFTDSSAWAAKLRFHATEILAIARHKPGFVTLKTVHVRISPMLTSKTGIENPVALSPATAELLRRTAETINDTELRTSLLQLSLNQ
jgi:hypothetical protein